MRIMGLDLGSKTIGVAVSDPLGFTAQGVEIIPINEQENEWGLERLKELIHLYQVEQFVIGLPKHMNNSEGERSQASKLFGEKLSHSFHLPVVYQDERLTTLAAERLLIEQANVSRKKRKKVIDKIAAQLILQNYLDSRR